MCRRGPATEPSRAAKRKQAVAETELEMAIRRVAEGRARVERQRDLLEQMIRDGDSEDVIALGRELLAQLEASQQLSERHLGELRHRA